MSSLHEFAKRHKPNEEDQEDNNTNKIDQTESDEKTEIEDKTKETENKQCQDSAKIIHVNSKNENIAILKKGETINTIENEIRKDKIYTHKEIKKGEDEISNLESQPEVDGISGKFMESNKIDSPPETPEKINNTDDSTNKIESNMDDYAVPQIMNKTINDSSITIENKINIDENFVPEVESSKMNDLITKIENIENKTETQLEAVNIKDPLIRPLNSIPTANEDEPKGNINTKNDFVTTITKEVGNLKMDSSIKIDQPTTDEKLIITDHLFQPQVVNITEPSVVKKTNIDNQYNLFNKATSSIINDIIPIIADDNAPPLIQESTSNVDDQPTLQVEVSTITSQSYILENTKVDAKKIDDTIKNEIIQSDIQIKMSNSQPVTAPTTSNADNQNKQQLKSDIGDRRSEKIRLKTSIVDNQLVIVKCGNNTDQTTTTIQSCTVNQSKVRRTSIDYEPGNREKDNVTYDSNIITERANSIDDIPGIRVKSNIINVPSTVSEIVDNTDLQPEGQIIGSNIESETEVTKNPSPVPQILTESPGLSEDSVVFRAPLSECSRLVTPSSSTATNTTTRFERRMNRPACWSEKQLQYFKSENLWLRVKNGKLGCDVCIQVGKLNIKKRMGVSVSPEWTTFSITHYGSSLLQQQRSLRKKVFEHRKSMAHKMCQHILEHCKLSCKLKRTSVNSQAQRNTLITQEQEENSITQEGIEFQPTASVTSTSTATPSIQHRNEVLPTPIKEEYEEEQPFVTTMAFCRIKWEPPTNRVTQNQSIENDSSEEMHCEMFTPIIYRPSDQSSQNFDQQNQSDENLNNTLDEELDDQSNSSQTVPVQHNQSVQNSPDLQSEQHEQRVDQSTQIATSFEDEQNMSGSEDMSQNWDFSLTECPLLAYHATSSSEEQDLIKIFRTIYHLTKLNRPFADLPADLDIQKINGCNFQKTLENSGAVICSHISCEMKKKITKNIVDSNLKFSIILEEIKSLSDTPTLIIYLRSPIHRKTIDFFLDIVELQTLEAEEIYSALISCLTSYYINEKILKKRLLSICVDGVSNSLGINSRFPTLLYEKFPMIIMWYCSIHRLEISVGDTIEKISGTNYFQQFIDKLYNTCRTSPKNRKQLMDCAENLALQIFNVGSVLNTKWIASSFETIKSIWNEYSSLYNHFFDASKDISRNSDERSIYNELRLQLSSIGFVKNLGMMYDALQELNELSSELKQYEFSLVDVHNSICRQIKIFECMIRKPGPMAKKSLAAEGTETFFHVPLQKIEQSGLEINREKFFEELSKNLKCRLLSTKPSQLTTERNNYLPLIAELKVLQKKFWPDDFSITYGEEELTSLCERIGVESRPIIRSFRVFKETGNMSLNVELHRLNSTIRIVPVSTTECQRVLKHLNSITKTQRTIPIMLLSDILFTQLYGPPVGEFVPLRYIRSWPDLQDHLNKTQDDVIEIKEEITSLVERTLWKLF